LKQSVAYWCLGLTEWQWNIDRICQTAHDLGLVGIELVPPPLLPTVREKGLLCTLGTNGMPDPPFQKGVNNPKYHSEVIASTKNAIDTCAEFDVPNVIAFTGYKWLDVDDPERGELPRQQAAENSIRALRELAEYAAQKGVTVCLEHLNTRDDTHPMKGHPGYQGDDVDYCAEIVRQVRSPFVRLLFDVYHVQVMHGDVIRRIYQNRDVIGHIHTAGNPGRGELDGNQEIYYPPVRRALEQISYDRFVGHEFIPTREPLDGLTQAAEMFR
jgi:sugar phosphate isomerase/epimerase